MREEIVNLRSALQRSFKERDDEITCSLLALCAGEHVLFLGPPGTAKSQLARGICEAIDGGFFYYLLTRFTTPEEVFGPLSLKALQEDDFRRKIDGYLPAAHIAFLDEIFKSNSSLLNSFLTILNERKFNNGRDTIDVPLISLFGASNELPAEDEHLEALYDRFLFRCAVSPIQEEENFRDMLFGREPGRTDPPRLTLDRIRDLQKAARSVPVDETVQRIIVRARKELMLRQVTVTDRRWKKIVDVLRVAAAAAGRPSVDRSLVILLQHMAWEQPEQRGVVRNLLVDLIITGGESIDKLARDAGDLRALLLRAIDRPFPYPVRCYDCGAMSATSRQLAIHEKDQPGHRYFDPHRTSLNLRYLDYDRLLEALKGEYGWDFVASPARKKREYLAEFRTLKGRFDETVGKAVDGMDQLRQQLAGNVWVSDRDQAEILGRYEAQLRAVDDIGDSLRSIEMMLDQVVE